MSISRRNFLKTAAAGAVGAAALGLTGCSKETTGGVELFNAGTYTSTQTTGYATVDVTTVFSSTAIEDVSYQVTKTSENDFFQAQASKIAELCKRIVSSQSTKVDGVSGASLSTKAITNGVADCIAQAATIELTAAAAASAVGGTYDVLGTSYCQDNRGSDPKAAASKTLEEYINQKGDGFAFKSMSVGKVGSLEIAPADFMLNKPAWLGDEPELKVDYVLDKTYEVVVVGSGEAGITATLRSAELCLQTLCCEVQTWDEYDNYACDMSTYNSEYFLNKAGKDSKFDTMAVFNQYMRCALGHANQHIVREFATRSGEMLDWMFSYLPKEYIGKYAKAMNYKGNKHFDGEACGMEYYNAMTQWRDVGDNTTNSNNNMWPYMTRLLQKEAQKLGAEYIYGAQIIRTVRNADGDITGLVGTDIDGKCFQVNCKTAVIAAGDFGGNPDMRLDICDHMRNLAWSYGGDRTDVNSITSGGRDGSGIRLCMWAGGTMEAGPRAGQASGITRKPDFAFGGCWPIFGPEGKRFFNETLTKHGSQGYLDMLPADQLLICVTDSNWDEYCEWQGYGHEVMDRSNKYMLEKVRSDMAKYKTGADGFPCQIFARYGNESGTVYAADTLEELCEIVGYNKEETANFIAEVKHWNEMCDAGYDSDWGADKHMMHMKIIDAPFFFNYTTTGGTPSGGLCQHAGINTDDYYRVTDKDHHPIKGLYAVGNTCGNRYAIQYATPTSGNSCGSALTTGFCCADYISEDLKG